MGVNVPVVFDHIWYHVVPYLLDLYECKLKCLLKNVISLRIKHFKRKKSAFPLANEQLSYLKVRLLSFCDRGEKEKQYD